MYENKQYIGLAPDELLFRGNKKEDTVLLRIIDFDAENLKEGDVEAVSELNEYQHKDSVSWINVDGLHNTSIMQEISSAFNLDTLAMAEVLKTDARPRVLEYDNCNLITIKMLRIDEVSCRTVVENLSFILTKTILISFQEQRGDVFDPIRERIRQNKKRIRNGGTDYLAFALLDIVVDNYLHIIYLLGEKIETLEEKLLQNPNQNVINEINNCKQELNFLRRNIKPAKEMINSLVKTESNFLSEGTYIHFKELEDNISQANDASNNYREILSDQLNIYHTTISTKLNDIMKFLTVFSVVFIPLTFIAGIYGTNFEYVPELHYRYSYFIMWIIMIIIAISMLIFFKKKNWF